MSKDKVCKVREILKIGRVLPETTKGWLCVDAKEYEKDDSDPIVFFPGKAKPYLAHEDCGAARVREGQWRKRGTQWNVNEWDRQDWLAIYGAGRLPKPGECTWIALEL